MSRSQSVINTCLNLANTPSPAYSEQLHAKELLPWKRLLVVKTFLTVTEISFDEKILLVVTELVVRSTQFTAQFTKPPAEPFPALPENAVKPSMGNGL